MYEYFKSFAKVIAAIEINKKNIKKQMEMKQKHIVLWAKISV